MKINHKLLYDSNNSYIKFSDGTMIQRKTVNFTPSMASWGNLYFADVNLGSFDVPFISKPIINATLKSTQYWLGGIEGTTATSIGTMRILRQINSFNQNTYVDIIAIGKWK